jgi:hypothetical protein
MQPARVGPDLIATKSQSLPTDVQPATMSSGDQSRRTFVRPCADQPFGLTRRRNAETRRRSTPQLLCTLGRYGGPGPEGGAAIRCVHHGCPIRGPSLPRSCTTRSPTSVSTHARSACTPRAHGKCSSHGPCNTPSAGSGMEALHPISGPDGAAPGNEAPAAADRFLREDGRSRAG